MPPNSQQRAIFVYLRSKDDHKSCTPAGAKLTDEYTPRTNKNNPSTISVTPPQLCTFFSKRTNSSVDISDFLPRKWANSSDLSFDSSEVSFDSSEEFFISYLGIGKFLGRNSILREKGVIREVPQQLCSNNQTVYFLAIVICNF